jgi:hypothetical protein
VKTKTTVIIIPGNGNSDINGNWYPYVKRELQKLGIEVIAKNMPDPDLARRKYWIPFMEKELAGKKNVILIGHSSGAIAALRYLERHKVFGAVLVSAYHTDLDDKKERISGYFDDEWKWDSIKKNVKWIIQFASMDDPFIPIEEAHYVRDKLGTEYHESVDQGHFGADKKKRKFTGLVKAVKRRLKVC